MSAGSFSVEGVDDATRVPVEPMPSSPGAAFAAARGTRRNQLSGSERDTLKPLNQVFEAVMLPGEEQGDLHGVAAPLGGTV